MAVLPAPAAPLPAGQVFERMGLATEGADVLESLARVESCPRMVEDFRPISEGLEWGLSELHWDSAGITSFLDNNVPYVVNNDGMLSAKAAAVLFASCEADPPGGELLLFEFGAGSGLFARYLLDRFGELCRGRGRDYYDRVRYVVSDRSPRTVAQWREREIFAGHEGRVCLGVCDARSPRVVWAQDGSACALAGVRAVFCNYVLDSLPATILRRGDRGVEELQVRTVLTADTQRLQSATGLDLDEVRRLAASTDSAERLELLPAMKALDFECAFVPPDELPAYAEEALAFAAGLGLEQLVLNHGALLSLEEALGLLESSGFVLLNDYGAARTDQLRGVAMSQRFGPTTAMGLNLPLLDHHFSIRGVGVVEPEAGEDLPVHPRLLMTEPRPATCAAFRTAFSGRRHRDVDGPLAEARQHAAAGRLEPGLAAYREAVARQPFNWHLLGEVAEFVIRRAGDYQVGLDLARAALAINPWYSSTLWNLLGDACYYLQRYPEAHEAYLQARRIQPGDPFTCLNMAYSHAELGRPGEALQAIADGLAADGPGNFHRNLLEKQQEVLGRIINRWTAGQEWLARRDQALLASQKPAAQG